MTARAVVRWVSPLALMALIFYLSSQRDLDSGLGLVDLVGRKLVHAGLYALLCLLWWRALRTVARPRPAVLGALVIAIAYGASDEIHQSYVPTRTGTPVDVAIDAVGACLAALVLRRRTRPERLGAADEGETPGRPSPAAFGPRDAR